MGWEVERGGRGQEGPVTVKYKYQGTVQKQLGRPLDEPPARMGRDFSVPLSSAVLRNAEVHPLCSWHVLRGLRGEGGVERQGNGSGGFLSCGRNPPVIRTGGLLSRRLPLKPRFSENTLLVVLLFTAKAFYRSELFLFHG